MGSGTTNGGRAAGARARQAVALLRSVLAGAPPDEVSGAEAAALAEVLAEAERVAGAAKVLYARRVAAAGAHRDRGHGDAASWLAAVSGEPVGKARSTLAATQLLAGVPAVEAAFGRGELSGAQAGVVAGAVALRPSAAAELLATARGGSFRALKERAARVQRLARGEEGERAREARAHRGRFCRISEPEVGGMRLEAWLTKREGARLVARLERETDAVFEQARGDGEREPRERYRADALVRLAAGTGTGAGGRGSAGPVPHVLVRVDAAALRRGSLAGGEACEIAGVGQVPVATARDLLGDAFLTLLVTDGVDVRTVTSTKRTIPRTLRLALTVRDPTCVVPGCPVSDHLEIDHWRVDFARGGPTSLDNLARLCPRHHAMKTEGRFRLLGGPGRWRWVPRDRSSPGPGRYGRPPDVRDRVTAGAG